MKIAVIYQSKYGTTKKYAEWISEALNAELMEKSSVNTKDLSSYDIVIYGGGLYAGGIIGVELVAKNPCKNLVVFTVGLANPAITDYTKIIEKNLPEEIRKSARIFHLRGGIDYKSLGAIHRGMMGMMKRVITKKPQEELTDEDRAFLDSYGDKADFTDKETISPIVEYVKSVAGSAF